MFASCDSVQHCTADTCLHPTGAIIGDRKTLSLLLVMLAAVAAPLWFWLAARLRPATYIRMAAALVSISFALAFIALQVTQVFSIAVGLTAVTNLVTCPFLSLGMLGQEGVDVFKGDPVKLPIRRTTCLP